MRKILLLALIMIFAVSGSAQTANETFSAIEDAESDIQAMTDEDIPTQRVENLLETANNSYKAQRNFEQEGNDADYSRAIELAEEISDIQEQAFESSDRIEALENRLEELEETSVNLSEARSHLDAARTDFNDQRFGEVGPDIDAAYSAISEAQSAQTQLESFAAAQREGITSWIQTRVSYTRENPVRVGAGLFTSLLVIWFSLHEFYSYRLVSRRKRKKIKRDVLEDLMQEIQRDYYMKKEGSSVRFETKHDRFEEMHRDTVREIDVIDEKIKDRWSILVDLSIEEESKDIESLEEGKEA